MYSFAGPYIALHSPLKGPIQRYIGARPYEEEVPDEHVSKSDRGQAGPTVDGKKVASRNSYNKQYKRHLIGFFFKFS